MDRKKALEAARSESGWIDGEPGNRAGPMVIEHAEIRTGWPVTIHRTVGEYSVNPKNGCAGITFYGEGGPSTTMIPTGTILRWKPLEVERDRYSAACAVAQNA